MQTTQFYIQYIELHLKKACREKIQDTQQNIPISARIDNSDVKIFVKEEK
ncbi:17561_t:CDS:2 [Acaulospora colombiana]|uniref:17561_t:CDS:1 n=1 Tax=Acaulospora colombiana TaxID=27376 RepID=A0ACA9JWL3_9GLOM|nr:17561_t:CDS:2 [Acaulospora colombiana]